VQVYRRVALGVLASQEFAAKLLTFSEQRRINECLPVLASALSKVSDSLRDDLPGGMELAKRELALRRKVFEAQIWFLMAADLRRAFPSLQAAFERVLRDETLAQSRIRSSYLPTMPLVRDLLLFGYMATVIDDQEKGAVYNMLAEANKVLEYRTVSQTNIEAVTNLVGRRGKQAEWFLLVSVVGAVSSLSLASLVMAFKGTSGRLLILHSSKVMEVLRITNCLPLVRLSPTVEAVEKGQAQWNFVTGFGSTPVNDLTEFVSSKWRTLPHANPLTARGWQETLRRQSESSWTEQEAKFRLGLGYAWRFGHACVGRRLNLQPTACYSCGMCGA
jgi:hypothetical protein